MYEFHLSQRIMSGPKPSSHHSQLGMFGLECPKQTVEALEVMVGGHSVASDNVVQHAEVVEELGCVILVT